MIKLLKDKRGTMSIDMLGIVLVSAIMLALAVGLFVQLHKISELDHFAHEMVLKASETGKCEGAAIDKRYAQLVSATGISPTYTFDADYFNSVKKLVQYGEPITITLTLESRLIGFGDYYIPQTLTRTSTEQSMQYWK